MRRKKVKREGFMSDAPKHVASEFMHRGRAITVGTSFGQSIDISIRAYDGKHLFTILHPSDAINLIKNIGQLIGCDVSVIPQESNLNHEWSNYWKNIQQQNSKI